MPRRFLVALALAATAVLAACGSTPSGSPAVQPPTSGASTNPGTGTRDWCLNTAAEVSAAIGGTAVTAASSEAPGVGGGCFYTTADGKLVYSVATITNGSAVATFDAAKQTQGVVQVPGIGDDAIIMSPQGPLAVRKGNAFISLGTLPDSGITEADWRSKNEELARAAVGRL
jgi:hypothetical protein